MSAYSCRKELSFNHQLECLYVDIWNEYYKFEVKGGHAVNPLERLQGMQTCQSSPPVSMVLIQCLPTQVEDKENALNNDLRNISIKSNYYVSEEQHAIKKSKQNDIRKILNKHFFRSSSVMWYLAYPHFWKKESTEAFTPCEKMPTLKQLFDPF